MPTVAPATSTCTPTAAATAAASHAINATDPVAASARTLVPAPARHFVTPAFCHTLCNALPPSSPSLPPPTPSLPPCSGGFAFTQATLLLNRLDGAALGLQLSQEQVAYLVQALLLYAAFVNYLMVVRTAVHTGYILCLVTGLPEVHEHRQVLETVVVDESNVQQPDSQANSGSNAGTVRARGGESSGNAASARPAPREPARFEDEDIALNTENIISRARHLIRQMSIHFSVGFRCVTDVADQLSLRVHTGCCNALWLLCINAHTLPMRCCSELRLVPTYAHVFWAHTLLRTLPAPRVRPPAGFFTLHCPCRSSQRATYHSSLARLF